MNPSITGRITDETFELERMKVAAQQVLPAAMVHDLELSTSRDFFTDALVAQLSSYVLADHLIPSEYTFDLGEQPTSAWQHVKAEWFPTFSRWLHRPPRKRPLRKTLRVENYLAFPENTRVYPKDLGRTVRIQHYGLETWA